MTTSVGQKNLITDVKGLKIGNAHDADILTGTTVILPDERAVCGVAIAGGGPGTRETDALGADKLVDDVDAIVLSGGSVYGLAAADGVVASMGAEGKGFGLLDVTGVPKSPVIPSAILYDLANGGSKNWDIQPPYRDLGIAAYKDAKDSKGSFRLGKSGAGFGARAGAERGGLGSASAVTSDGLTVGALVAVNCFGATRIPSTQAFWAHPYEMMKEFGGERPPHDCSIDPDDWGAAKINPSADRQNTTIACIATDIGLTKGQAQRVAQMALSGLSRAIRPVFAPFDGDVVFAMSTAQKALPEPSALNLARLGELAANCLARAVARGVYEANIE
jgi:L-aminopeptidase/D-esterase-like protein